MAYTLHDGRVGRVIVPQGMRTQSGLFLLSPGQAAELVAQSPQNFNLDLSRWTLKTLLQV